MESFGRSVVYNLIEVGSRAISSSRRMHTNFSGCLLRASLVAPSQPSQKCMYNGS